MKYHFEMKSNLFPNTAALVVSCDNYADVWPIFFNLYRKFWPDNPLKTYLLTNFLAPEYDNIEAIDVGEDISWSDNLKTALNRISEEYVLLFLEDLLLVDAVNTSSFNDILSWSLENKVNYMRFNPSTKPDKLITQNIGLVNEGAVYRASVVVSLWKKDVLASLLKSGENAWEFEHYGSERSDAHAKFYSATTDQFRIVNSIIKRVWERSAARKLHKLGVTINYDTRRVMTLKEEIIWKFKLLRSKVFSLTPKKCRRKVKLFFQGDNYKY